MLEQLAPQAENRCFGCGGANPRGLKLHFTLDHERRRAMARVTLERDLQGSHEMAHGGIIALLLDEAMGKLNRLAGRGTRAVTAELSVEYLRPVPTGEVIEIEASITGEETGRRGINLKTEGEIRDASGQVLARGRARFVAIGARPEK